MNYFDLDCVDEVRSYNSNEFKSSDSFPESVDKQTNTLKRVIGPKFQSYN